MGKPTANSTTKRHSVGRIRLGTFTLSPWPPPLRADAIEAIDAPHHYVNAWSEAERRLSLEVVGEVYSRRRSVQLWEAVELTCSSAGKGIRVASIAGKANLPAPGEDLSGLLATEVLGRVLFPGRPTWLQESIGFAFDGAVDMERLREEVLRFLYAVRLTEARSTV